MRILILRSQRRRTSELPTDAYSQEFTSAYAERVIGNLVGEDDFCSACGPDCTRCRKAYGRRFADDIAGVIDLPAVLPYLLERPGRHLPEEIPDHDIILAINIHEQILLEFLKVVAGQAPLGGRRRRHGTRGVVVPIESGGWVSGSARQQAREICDSAGIEIDFPKPFCDFDPPPGGVLGEFRDRYHIGRPRVELTVTDGVIARAYVHVSAACGATYYVAHWLEGKRVDDDLRYEVVAKRMHSYPCTASMDWDYDLGDTIMHVASEAHYDILAPLGQAGGDAPEMVASPVGLMLPKPPSARDNMRNVERAKRAILADLAEGADVSVQSVCKKPKITPAAVYSAVILLKQAGKIRTQGQKILKP